MFTWPRLTKTVKWIIIINSVIWLLEVILLRMDIGKSLYNFFLIPVDVANGKVWQLITYSFFHSPNMFFHLILNMLVLWMFSASLEERWGRKNFIIFYLVAAFVGGVFAFLEGMFIITSHQLVPTIGASASVFALTAAFALTFPEMTIYLIFFPIKAKYLLYID
ncbi:rhomboid family intramembrane serine protease, partial [bacterium]|nr:rhomboid family intramembrane serine protease [bacterium]